MRDDCSGPQTSSATRLGPKPEFFWLPGCSSISQLKGTQHGYLHSWNLTVHRPAQALQHQPAKLSIPRDKCHPRHILARQQGRKMHPRRWLLDRWLWGRTIRGWGLRIHPRGDAEATQSQQRQLRVTSPWLWVIWRRGGHRGPSRPLPVSTQSGRDPPSVFILVTEGESLLFPATFIYHFTPVSMETSHDITGCNREVGRSAEAAGSQWHSAEQMLKLEKCNFSAKSNEVSGRRVEKH